MFPKWADYAFVLTVIIRPIFVRNKIKIYMFTSNVHTGVAGCTGMCRLYLE